jgi:hypothetical protein
MKAIDLEVPLDSIFEVFETKSIATGMMKVAPGNVTMRVLPGRVQKRSLTYDAAPVFTIASSMGTQHWPGRVCGSVKLSDSTLKM